MSKPQFAILAASLGGIGYGIIGVAFAVCGDRAYARFISAMAALLVLASFIGEAAA